MVKEPEIIINGYKLTDGMAMTVRVALESFAMDLNNEGLGDDAHGVAMTAAYLMSITKIRELIFKDTLQSKDDEG